jgi:hypothetical protein
MTAASHRILRRLRRLRLSKLLRRRPTVRLRRSHRPQVDIVQATRHRPQVVCTLVRVSRYFFSFAVPGLICHCEGTYYETGLGACGVTNNDGQNIVAMSKLLFDTYPYVICMLIITFPTHDGIYRRGYNGVNPNQNPICGKKLTAHCKWSPVHVVCLQCSYMLP